MPNRTVYAQGTPNWVDLQTTDTRRPRKTFYGRLFGWDYDDQPMPQGGAYSMATLRGRASSRDRLAVTGKWSLLVPRRCGTPTSPWTRVNGDVAAQVEGRPAAQLAMAPFDVINAGRMAFVMDPSGAAVALWQANKHIGATLVNEPGTFIWNELITDEPKAAEFYTQLLGVTTSTMDMGTGEYTLLPHGRRHGRRRRPPPMPGVPNHWHVYFAVDDADATAAKISGAGRLDPGRAGRQPGGPDRRSP